PPSEIGLEKKVILDEILFYEDDPEDLLMLKLENKCFAATCYQNQILGTRKSVSALRREDFVKYHADYFVPENCSITIVGDFNLEKVLRETARYFGEKEWKKSPSGPKNFDFLNMIERQSHSVIRKDNKFSQDYTGFSFKVPASIDGINASAMFLPYIFSTMKSSPLPYFLREKTQAASSLSADLIFKFGAWMFAVVASGGARRLDLVSSSISDFIRNASSLMTPDVFESMKKILLLEYFQEIETARSYCNELATFDHVLGEGSHGRSIKNILELKYGGFIEYLENTVSKSVCHRVELISSVKSGNVAARPRASFLDEKTFKNASRLVAPVKYSSFPARERAGFKKPIVKSENISRDIRLASVIDGTLGYSSLNLYIQGGAISSIVPGDSYVFSELFGRRTRSLGMFQNYRVSDGMGLLVDCNSFLDFIQIDAICPGVWDRDSIGHIHRLLAGFDFSGVMLANARRSVRKMVRSIEDDVFEFSFWNFVKALFKDHPYSKVIFGNEKAISRITSADIQKYYGALKTASDVSVSYASSRNVTPLMNELLEGFFKPHEAFAGKIPRPKESKLIRVAELTVPSKQSQCSLIIGGVGPKAYSSEAMPFLIANYILSDYSGKRLWSIRENFGLCYNIFSEYIPLALNGIFFCCVNTDAPKLDSVIEKVSNELDRFVSNGPTEKEIEEARGQIMKKIETSMQSSFQLAKGAGQAIYYRKELSEFLDYKKRISEATSGDINAAIKKYMRVKDLMVLKVMPR
ncbi:MAG TPA: insulinase family protein, partial [Candidatus Wallbacteria bacterium]|nr:insulinase family protein [Candidatus Wallbacteria bacterium]